MRSFFSFVGGVVALALIVGGIIFAAENATTHNYSFLGTTFSMPIWVLAGLAALAGFLLALVVVTPARVAADARHGQLRAHTRQLERDLTDAHTTNERLQSQLTTLQAEHAVASRERDAYRGRLDNVRAASDQPAGATAGAPVPPATTPTTTPTTEGTPAASEGVVFGRRETDVAAPEGVETARETEQTAATAPGGGLGDRLRTLFGKPDVTNQDETPQGPAVPA